MQNIKKVQNKGPFFIVGYSFGGSVAYEMAAQLEAQGTKVNLVLLDGSPGYVSQHTGIYKNQRDFDSNEFAPIIGAYLRFIAIFRDINFKQVGNQFQNNFEVNPNSKKGGNREGSNRTGVKLGCIVVLSVGVRLSVSLLQ